MYQKLGLNKKATKQQIKKSYRDKAKTCHPDIKKGKEEEFRQISKAYSVLIDDEKRQRYDNGENVDDILNDSSNKPIEIINKIFSEVINAERVDVRTQDIVKTIKLNIEQFIGDIDKEIKKQAKIEEKFNIFIKSLIHDKKESSILYQIAQSNINNVKSNIGQAKKYRLDLEEAFKIIKEYDYETAETDPFAGRFRGSTSTM